MPPDVYVFGGFRCHLLLPHDVIGSIIDDRPTWPGLTVEGSEYLDDRVYLRNGKPVLQVRREGDKTTVRALAEVWIQEPGLSVKVRGEGIWRGLGADGEFTSPPYTLKAKDAHRSTVHFSRAKRSTRFTVGVQYTQGVFRRRWLSDGRFVTPLNRPATPALVPWQGAEVFGQGYELRGVAEGYEAFRRWELAGHRDSDWMNFLGWTGGAGCVTNAEGRTPPPGMDVDASDGYDRIWQPRSWRRLKPGASIAQTLTTRT